MIDDDIKVKDFSGNVYTKEEFINEIKDYNSEGFDFYIGTDSQIFSEHVSMVTAICPRKISEGTGTSARIFYVKAKLDPRDCPNLRTRMLMEAYRSIEAAMDLEPYISSKISIHLDVGSGSRSKTSAYQKELQYLVTAQGYECKIKPDSWAAGGVADKYSKS